MGPCGLTANPRPGVDARAWQRARLRIPKRMGCGKSRAARTFFYKEGGFPPAPTPPGAPLPFPGPVLPLFQRLFHGLFPPPGLAAGFIEEAKKNVIVP